jgi:hypothetical protein
MIGRIAGASILALIVTAAAAPVAAAARAHTTRAHVGKSHVTSAYATRAYDGSWSLSIITDRGGCDRSYDFAVQIANGIVSHPNLVRLRGRVVGNGAVRVSVSVGDKHASGAGRLSRSSGSGRWSGYAGGSRCSGHWRAQRY